jgi:cbb3-type cytochrome c oxidase subunit III
VRTTLAALAALAASSTLAGCGTGGLAPAGDASNGKKLFAAKCAQCHTLADAGSQSAIGPNLDDAFAAIREQPEDRSFNEGTIRQVVADQIKFSVEPMPQNLVTGEDADDVATYVASVAGVNGFTKPGAGASAAGGKSIFSANCASCHTLGAAGATGTVGPNLDDLKPSAARAKRQVTNGGGGMPAFKGQLTDAQIDAVAAYVASNAGKKSG